MTIEKVTVHDLQPENLYLGNTLDVTPSAPTSRFEIAAIEPRERALEVVWRDGHRSEFHFMWLRHNCFCRECGSSQDGIRFNLITDIDPDVSGVAELDHDGSLRVVWKPEGHQSCFGASWLRAHCYS